MSTGQLPASPLYILLASHFSLISSHNIKPCKMEAIHVLRMISSTMNSGDWLYIVDNKPKEFNVDSCWQHTVKAAKLMRNVNST